MKNHTVSLIFVSLMTATAFVCASPDQKNTSLNSNSDVAYQALQNQEYSKAYKLFVALAEKGDPLAQLQTGIMLEQGLGVRRNEKEAAKWYEKAASVNTRGALNNLAAMYYEGRGVPKDFVRAAKLYQRAADIGDLSATTMLGSMYEQGQGVEVNLQKAAQLYKSAAEKGYAYAQTSLGMMYWSGKGVPENNVEAYAWWTVADENGDRFAAQNLEKLSKKLTDSERAQGERLARDYKQRFSKIEQRRSQ